MGPSYPGQLVKAAAWGTGLRHAGVLVDPVGLRTLARDAQDSWSTTRAHGHWSESPGKVDRPRGPSDPRPSHLGELVKAPGTGIRAKVAQDIYRARVTSGMGPRFPGQLVDPADPCTQSRVARECWSTPRVLVH